MAQAADAPIPAAASYLDPAGIDRLYEALPPLENVSEEAVKGLLRRATTLVRRVPPWTQAFMQEWEAATGASFQRSLFRAEAFVAQMTMESLDGGPPMKDVRDGRVRALAEDTKQLGAGVAPFYAGRYSASFYHDRLHLLPVLGFERMLLDILRDPNVTPERRASVEVLRTKLSDAQVAYFASSTNFPAPLPQLLRRWVLPLYYNLSTSSSKTSLSPKDLIKALRKVDPTLPLQIRKSSRSAAPAAPAALPSVELEVPDLAPDQDEGVRQAMNQGAWVTSSTLDSPAREPSVLPENPLLEMPLETPVAEAISESLRGMSAILPALPARAPSELETPVGTFLETEPSTVDPASLREASNFLFEGVSLPYRAPSSTWRGSLSPAESDPLSLAPARALSSLERDFDNMPEGVSLFGLGRDNVISSPQRVYSNTSLSVSADLFDVAGLVPSRAGSMSAPSRASSASDPKRERSVTILANSQFDLQPVEEDEQVRKRRKGMGLKLSLDVSWQELHKRAEDRVQRASLSASPEERKRWIDTWIRGVKWSIELENAWYAHTGVAFELALYHAQEAAAKISVFDANKARARGGEETDRLGMRTAAVASVVRLASQAAAKVPQDWPALSPFGNTRYSKTFLTTNLEWIPLLFLEQHLVEMVHEAIDRGDKDAYTQLNRLRRWIASTPSKQLVRAESKMIGPASPTLRSQLLTLYFGLEEEVKAASVETLPVKETQREVVPQVRQQANLRLAYAVIEVGLEQRHAFMRSWLPNPAWVQRHAQAWLDATGTSLDDTLYLAERRTAWIKSFDFARAKIRKGTVVRKLLMDRVKSEVEKTLGFVKWTVYLGWPAPGPFPSKEFHPAFLFLEQELAETLSTAVQTGNKDQYTKVVRVREVLAADPLPPFPTLESKEFGKKVLTAYYNLVGEGDEWIQQQLRAARELSSELESEELLDAHSRAHDQRMAEAELQKELQEKEEDIREARMADAATRIEAEEAEVPDTTSFEDEEAEAREWILDRARMDDYAKKESEVVQLFTQAAVRPRMTTRSSKRAAEEVTRSKKKKKKGTGLRLAAGVTAAEVRQEAEKRVLALSTYIPKEQRLELLRPWTHEVTWTKETLIQPWEAATGTEFDLALFYAQKECYWIDTMPVRKGGPNRDFLRMQLLRDLALQTEAAKVAAAKLGWPDLAPSAVKRYHSNFLNMHLGLFALAFLDQHLIQLVRQAIQRVDAEEYLRLEKMRLLLSHTPTSELFLAKVKRTHNVYLPVLDRDEMLRAYYDIPSQTPLELKQSVEAEELRLKEDVAKEGIDVPELRALEAQALNQARVRANSLLRKGSNVPAIVPAAAAAAAAIVPAAATVRDPATSAAEMLMSLGKRPAETDNDNRGNKRRVKEDICCNMACRKAVGDKPHVCTHCRNKDDAIYCSAACLASDAAGHKPLCMLHVNYSA